MVPLDPDLEPLGEGAGSVEHAERVVDRDDRRALAGERDRGLARSAPQVGDPLALHVADEAQLLLGGAVGPVEDGVGLRVVDGAGRNPVPALGVGHPVILLEDNRPGAHAPCEVAGGAGAVEQEPRAAPVRKKAGWRTDGRANQR